MINILPPSFKKELKQEENLRLLVILLILLLLFLLSLSFLLGSLRIYLSGEIKAQEIQLIMQQEAFESYGTQEVIKDMNRNIINVADMYRRQVPLTEILDSIARDLPNDMVIRHFSYTPTREVIVRDEPQTILAKLTLSGDAPTRETLFSFKESLEKNILFLSVTFPPSNWATPKDISFSASLELQQ